MPLLPIVFTSIGIRIINPHDDWAIDLRVDDAEAMGERLVQMGRKWREMEKVKQENETVVEALQRLGVKFE